MKRGQLPLLTFIYFGLYALFVLGVKLGQAPKIDGFPGLSDLEVLVYATFGASAVCLGAIVSFRWWKFRPRGRELLYLFLSGTFLTLLIPAAALLYSLPFSAMEAIVLLRAGQIAAARLVDSVLLRQGISRKKVRWEENAAAVFSLAAIGIFLGIARPGDSAFLHSGLALLILALATVAYAARLYLLNSLKFTRDEGASNTSRNYFAVEQITVALWLTVALTTAFAAPGFFGGAHLREVIDAPPEHWLLALLLGLPLGAAAYFSISLLLFPQKSATSTALFNQLATLLAGTAATLLFAGFFGGASPEPLDWLSLALVLLALFYLARAEKKDRREPA